MKKILLVMCLFIMLIFLSFVFIQDLEASTNLIVYTPNGSIVSGDDRSDVEDYDLDVKEEIHNELIANYPNMELIYPATKRFNCFSYAFYSQDCDNNNYFIMEPDIYIEDGSYIDGEWDEGNILCYRKTSGFNEIFHAAIIISNPKNISLNSGSLNTKELEDVIVVSKLGGKGVYRHTVLDYLKLDTGTCEFNCYKPRTHSTIDFTANSVTMDKNYNVATNDYVMYKVNLLENANYNFYSSSNNALEIKLYNSQMNLITDKPIEFIENSYSICEYLNAGTYYFRICFESSLAQGNIFLRVRKITNPLNNGLVIDPYYGNMQGTQITILEENMLASDKSYYSNVITQGFTRLVFFTNGESRLDYYWVSSNETVLSVTQYGTVLAKRVFETKNASIYIYSKEDPSIVYKLDFVIVPYEGEKITIDIDMIMSINEEEDVYIQLNSSVPYNFLQYYTWIPEDYSYCSVDDFGRIDATKTGNVRIKGTYLLNSKVEVYINLTIIN